MISYVRARRLLRLRRSTTAPITIAAPPANRALNTLEPVNGSVPLDPLEQPDPGDEAWRMVLAVYTGPEPPGWSVAVSW